ncbi:MAG TPA: hypothetical protein VG734_09990 [Lacunisphaera sp.]|nr:hypothetical protein [Lacunisphaera sp.]
MKSVYHSWIAFVDILGFGQFCEKNPPEELGRLLDQTLFKVPGEIREVMTSIDGAFSKKTFDAVLCPRHMVISDSILFFQTPLLDDEEAVRSAKLAIFCLYVAQFANLMMAAGLPVRGSISHGSFFLGPGIAAGTPIIDAYKEGNDLQFAGITFAASCEATLLANDKNRKPEETDLLRLKGIPIARKSDVPCASGTRSRFLLFTYDANDYQDCHGHFAYPAFKGDENLCRSLFDSFAAYNKGCDDSVLLKLENTARLIALMEA